MSYIGATQGTSSPVLLDAITVVNNQAAYTMQKDGVNYTPASTLVMQVSLNGIIQAPNSSYTINGSTITFDSALVTGDTIDYILVREPTTGTIAPVDGSVTNSKIVSMAASKLTGALPALDGSALTGLSSPSYALLEDQKTAGTTGGTSQTSFTKRDLNTEVYDPDGIVSISSNQFTLVAGTYLIEWACPAYASGDNETRLYNATTSTSAAVGMSVWADSSGSGGSAVVPGKTVQTLTGSTTFEIQHRSTSSVASGFGNPNDLGGICVYTQVMITKIA